MQALGHLRQHLQLVLRMARATRTDLVAARSSGELTSREWADIVRTCRQCDWSGKCRKWLDLREQVACAPENCPNNHRFDVIGSRHPLPARD